MRRWQGLRPHIGMPGQEVVDLGHRADRPAVAHSPPGCPGGGCGAGRLAKPLGRAEPPNAAPCATIPKRRTKSTPASVKPMRDCRPTWLLIPQSRRPRPSPLADPGPRWRCCGNRASTATSKWRRPSTGLDFTAVDVHMTELISGAVPLLDFPVLAACGGFSYGDVLGGGGGWAEEHSPSRCCARRLCSLLCRGSADAWRLQRLPDDGPSQGVDSGR